MAEQSKEIAVVEEIDNALVEKTCEHIIEVFSRHIGNALIETGDYLIKEFFDDDHELARDKGLIETSTKWTSLNQVFEKFKSESSEGKTKSPSKSWLYLSINIAVQEKDFKELGQDDKSFQTFGKLSVSQKIALSDIKDFDDKKEFLETTDIENFSVREFKKEVSKFLGSSREISHGILTLIKKPELLFLEESQNKIEIEKLQKKTLEDLEKYQDRLFEKRKELKEDVEKKTKDYKLYFEKFDEVKENIDEALKIVKAKTKRKGKTKKVKKS